MQTQPSQSHHADFLSSKTKLSQKLKLLINRLWTATIVFCRAEGRNIANWETLTLILYHYMNVSVVFFFKVGTWDPLSSLAAAGSGASWAGATQQAFLHVLQVLLVLLADSQQPHTLQ
jgi:hypothetical protein